MIEFIELILSKVMLVLFMSLPFLWVIQLIRLGFISLKSNWKNIFLVVMFWFGGGFWLTMEMFFGETFVFASLAIITFGSGFVLLLFWERSNREINHGKKNGSNRLKWSKAWIVVLVVNTLIFWVLERELGSRGPLEVTIEVDEMGKEDFVVSTLYYVGGHTSYSNYEFKKIVKAGEAVTFPRSYVTFGFFQDWLYPERTKNAIGIYVWHPEYENHNGMIYLKYEFPHRTTKKTIHLTHWDTKFAKMEERVKLEPDRAFEIEYKTYRAFVHDIGSATRSWVQEFSDEEKENLKAKYLPWIEKTRAAYSDKYWNCSSVTDCKRKQLKGISSGYKPHSYPFK